MKIMKLVMIAIAIVAVAVLAIAAFAGCLLYVGSDALSSRATDSETLTPAGTAIGKALVVYNPALMGAPKAAASKIAADLQDKGYEVCLAGISSPAAKNVSGYDVIVVGGPVYGGVVSSSVQSYLKALAPPESAKIGAFASGNNVSEEPFPAGVSLKTSAIISSYEDVDGQCAAFTDKLLE